MSSYLKDVILEGYVVENQFTMNILDLFINEAPCGKVVLVLKLMTLSIIMYYVG